MQTYLIKIFILIPADATEGDGGQSALLVTEFIGDQFFVKCIAIFCHRNRGAETKRRDRNRVIVVLKSSSVEREEGTC